MEAIRTTWFKDCTGICDKQMNDKVVHQLFDAIFKGEGKWQKRLARMRNALREHADDILKIDIPEDIVLLILDFQEHDNKKRTALIEQAKQEFDGEQ